MVHSTYLIHTQLLNLFVYLAPASALRPRPKRQQEILVLSSPEGLHDVHNYYMRTPFSNKAREKIGQCMVIYGYHMVLLSDILSLIWFSLEGEQSTHCLVNTFTWIPDQSMVDL